METSYLLRRNIINNYMAMNPEKVVDIAIDLWEQLAREIISIVGESGFYSLYAKYIPYSIKFSLARGKLTVATDSSPVRGIKNEL
jgi:hypothetical protein